MTSLNKIIKGFTRVEKELEAYVATAKSEVKQTNIQINTLEARRSTIQGEQQRAEGILSRVKSLVA